MKNERLYAELYEAALKKYIQINASLLGEIVIHLRCDITNKQIEALLSKFQKYGYFAIYYDDWHMFRLPSSKCQEYHNWCIYNRVI